MLPRARYSAAVIRGRGRGKKIGFPTLNLRIPEAFPYAHGIYAGRVWIGAKNHPAAFHFGPIPAFRETETSLEAFLIDTKLDEAPPLIEFELVEYIREIKNFPAVADLTAQIEKDVTAVKEILKNAPN